MPIYRSEIQETARSKQYLVLTLTSILLLLPQLSITGHAQAKQPITKEILVRALTQGAQNRKLRATAAKYVEIIKEHGVDFSITSTDEQNIRKAGSYLGTLHLDKLIAAVRDNYRMLSGNVEPVELSGNVEQVEVTPHPAGGLQVLVRLSIRNNGSPSIAHRYSLHIKHATSKSIDFKEPAGKFDKPVTVTSAGGTEKLIVQPQEALDVKTTQAIPRNRTVSGWLKFDFTIISGVPDKYLRQSGTQFILTFADVAGKRYEAKYYIP